MNEQHARRPDGPWSEDWLDRSETPGQANPTERFPTEQFPTAQFPPAEQHEPQRYEPQRFAHPHQPAQPYARPPEPLAHEGGFPYGMPPAAPYGPTAPYGPGQQFGYADQFIP